MNTIALLPVIIDTVEEMLSKNEKIFEEQIKNFEKNLEQLREQLFHCISEANQKSNVVVVEDSSLREKLKSLEIQIEEIKTKCLEEIQKVCENQQNIEKSTSSVINERLKDYSQTVVQSFVSSLKERLEYSEMRYRLLRNLFSRLEELLKEGRRGQILISDGEGWLSWASAPRSGGGGSRSPQEVDLSRVFRAFVVDFDTGQIVVDRDTSYVVYDKEVL